ncbi:MAG: aldo/keto reductase [Marmoricola sp.]
MSGLALGMMSYGNTSLRTWHLDADQGEPIVRRAVEAGVTFFDTADMYDPGASEEVTGRLLSGLFARREDYVLSTKVHFPMGPGPNDRGLSRKHFMSAIDASLLRLGTDYVDIYQIHRWDPNSPVEEVMEVLHDVVKSGRARYLGASSMYAWQFGKAQHVARTHGWTPFVSMQNQYNLIYREEEREMIPLCRDLGVGVIPYSPLARGLLAGNRTRERGNTTSRADNDPLADDMYEPADFDVVDVVRATARRRGISLAQVAIAWLASRPGVTAPLIGATKISHIDEAVASLELSLDEAEIDHLEAPYLPHRVLGHD